MIALISSTANLPAVLSMASLVGFAHHNASYSDDNEEESIVESVDGTRDEALRSLARNPETVSKGKEYYTGYCLACHGPEGVDVDAPSNLFDEKWYHGAKPSAIERAIRQGVMEKGMPAWGQMIPDEQIESLIAYLLSFQNSKNETNA